jgi:choline-sulfatase
MRYRMNVMRAAGEIEPNSIVMNQRPNILLIMTDQQRGDCLSAEGHEVLLTPNMDDIGARGARFRRAYSTCPVCIPARRSLMSGQFPATHGLVGYRDGIEWDAPPTLPGVLRDAGYQTALVGRSMHQFPTRKRYGFEEMVTADHKEARNPYAEFLRLNAPVGNASWMGGGVMHNDWTARSWHLDESLHFTNWVVDESLAFLERRDPSCPFFLTVSFIAPHPPLQPPAFYMERYLRTGVPQPIIGDWAEPPHDQGRSDRVAPIHLQLEGEALLSTRAAYYGLINHVDDQLRRLLNPVTGVPALVGENTIILFTSDHGEMLGDHYFWRKSQPYEPSSRIPFLLQAPQRCGFVPETVIDEAVCLEDIMPTLLDLAEVEIPPTVEGRSLVPLLRGESTLQREYLHLECAPFFQALTNGKEKYVWLPQSGAEQFFDLENDPQELHDLSNAPDSQSTLAQWRTRLIAELKDRPEGFTDGQQLIAGRADAKVLLHAGKTH